MDLDPSIKKQKINKTLISAVWWLPNDLFSLKTDVNVPSESKKRNKLEIFVVVGILEVTDKKSRIRKSSGRIQGYGSGCVPKRHGSGSAVLRIWISIILEAGSGYVSEWKAGSGSASKSKAVRLHRDPHQSIKKTRIQIRIAECWSAINTGAVYDFPLLLYCGYVPGIRLLTSDSSF